MNNIDNVKSEKAGTTEESTVHTWQDDLASQPLPGDNTPLIERQTGEYAQALDIARNSIG
jgi:hypothetical protein